MPKVKKFKTYLNQILSENWPPKCGHYISKNGLKIAKLKKTKKNTPKIPKIPKMIKSDQNSPLCKKNDKCGNSGSKKVK